MSDFLTLLATKQRKGSDIASAATITVPLNGDSFSVTGSTGITTINTNGRGNGARFYLRFAGAVTLANGENLSLAGGANLTTAANDVLFFEVTGENSVSQIGLGGVVSDSASGERLEWQLPGAIATGLSFKKRINDARTLKWFKCDALTAPSTDTTFDILKNGTSIFTEAPKPVLEKDVTYVETNGFDTGADECEDNDVFQLNVVSGSGAADFNVTLYFE